MRDLDLIDLSDNETVVDNNPRGERQSQWEKINQLQIQLEDMRNVFLLCYHKQYPDSRALQICR
jgi:hypothetical protein